MKKNAKILISVGVVVAVAVGAFSFMDGSFTQGRLAYRSDNGPSLLVSAVKIGRDGKEQIQKNVTIEEYSTKDGLLKTFAKSSESPSGKVTFGKNSLIDYDYFYFIGRGDDGTTYGGAYTDNEGCNNIEMSLEKNNFLLIHSNMYANAFDQVSLKTNPVAKNNWENRGFVFDDSTLSVKEWKLYPVDSSKYYQASYCPKPAIGSVQPSLGNPKN